MHRILIVDDDRLLVRTMRQVFERANLGLDVVVAHSSAELAEQVPCLPAFDLVFMGYELKEAKTGIDLARELRERGYTGPLLLMSGGVEFTAHANDPAITELLYKPWNYKFRPEEMKPGSPDVLLHCLNYYLK